MENILSERVKKLLMPSGIILLIILFFIVPIIYAYFNKETDESRNDREQIKELSLNSLNGDPIDLQKYDDKKLWVVNSWSTWCTFCIEELPHFAQLQKEFIDDIVVIAINRGEPVEANKTFFSVTKLQEDQLLYLLDSEDQFYKEIGGIGMPETVFIDQSGNIVKHVRGPLDLEEMRTITSELLND